MSIAGMMLMMLGHWWRKLVLWWKLRDKAADEMPLMHPTRSTLQWINAAEEKYLEEYNAGIVCNTPWTMSMIKNMYIFGKINESILIANPGYAHSYFCLLYKKRGVNKLMWPFKQLSALGISKSHFQHGNKNMEIKTLYKRLKELEAQGHVYITEFCPHKCIPTGDCRVTFLILK